MPNYQQVSFAHSQGQIKLFCRDILLFSIKESFLPKTHFALIGTRARKEAMKKSISSRNTAIIQVKTLVFSAYSGKWSCFSSNSLIMRRLRVFFCHFRAILLLSRRVLQVCAEFIAK